MAIKTVQEESLTAIGDAIRAKAGGQEPLEFPTGMVKAIEEIEAKPVMEPIVLTGDASYACSGPICSAFIKTFGDTISTEKLTQTPFMFSKTTLEEIPFDINYLGASYYSASSMFDGAKYLKKLPKLNNLYSDNLQSFLNGCESLVEIPEGWMDSWNLTKFHTYVYAYGPYFFRNCYSLRKIPSSILEIFYNPATASYSSVYSQIFSNCYNLDEINKLAVSPASLTTDVFTSAFYQTNCLKHLIFKKNEDDSPQVAEWKNQTIDLSKSVGYYKIEYSYHRRDTRLYQSGRIIEDCIYNDATYELNKNNPNAYVAGYASENPVQYSFYNHDSAVETINSLPDCSAYGTNTIKFEGQAGSATDGGAINTLTAEEIAVATAKGWTVSLV